MTQAFHAYGNHKYTHTHTLYRFHFNNLLVVTLIMKIISILYKKITVELGQQDKFLSITYHSLMVHNKVCSLL